MRWTDDPVDIDRDRAEAACDAAQDRADAEIRAALAIRSSVELDAEAMRAAEDADDLRHLPIGITKAAAIRRGWIKE